MNIFYENDQDNRKSIHLKRGKNFLFPAHFHKKLELFLLKKGSVEISSNGKSYELTPGFIAFFNSYDMHSYNKETTDIDAYCLIIPTEYASRFCERNKNKALGSPVIYDPALCEEIFSLVHSYLDKEKGVEVQKSCVEFILSLIETRLLFTEGGGDSETTNLVRKILVFINDNYKGDVSLGTISHKLGYSNAHVSRAFAKYVKKSLPEYVNELRYKEVLRLEKNGECKLTELIFKAGFKSLQTYYRYKKRIENE